VGRLGAYQDFNVMVRFDMNSHCSDTQGRVAVGRDACYSNYTVADQLQPNPTQWNLIVGRNLTFVDGDVMNGATAVGGVLKTRRVGYYGGVRRAQPLNFQNAFSEIEAISLQLHRVPSNGQTGVKMLESRRELRFQGTHPEVNVFRVMAHEISLAHTVRIEVPEGSTVLVNIDGRDFRMFSHGIYPVGVDSTRILWNAPQALTAHIQFINVLGSVLAPRADVAFPSGLFTGSLFARSLQGNGQFNLSLFQGCLPKKNP
jgi:choice-of-anchor A domain-containing protein